MPWAFVSIVAPGQYIKANIAKQKEEAEKLRREKIAQSLIEEEDREKKQGNVVRNRKSQG